MQMNSNILQIDASKTYTHQEEDIIELRIDELKPLQINFSKLVFQSKYIRDKYKFSDTMNNIQIEIDEIINQIGLNKESIRYFVQFIQDEKVSIPINYFTDIYRLSEHFCVSKLTTELDNISKEKLFKDLNFTIQTLRDLITKRNKLEKENEIETSFTSKLEKCLSSRIKECIENPTFLELPVSIVYRILEMSGKENIDSNKLLEIILERIEDRFILLKLVELHKLSEEKVDELIEIFESKSDVFKKYFEYMPINFLFIKEMRDKLKTNIKENEKNKTELEQTKIKLEEMRNKFKLILQENEELKQQVQKKDEELKQVKCKQNDALKENEQLKVKLSEANKRKKEEDVQMKCENIQFAKNIVVGGADFDNRHGVQANSKNKGNSPVISPPLNLPFDPSSLLSYSVYYSHSVVVTRSGSMNVVGYNCDGRISSSIEKTRIGQFTKYSMKDNNGQPLVPISVVCTECGTLYMLSKSCNSGRQLVYCDFNINGGDPVFLDIGDEEPVSLFGGCDHSEAISDKGEVIFINLSAVKNSPNSRISAVSLPGDEKAMMVACLNRSIFVLSSCRRVFVSDIESGSCLLKFSAVSELSNKEIIWLSGTYEHCFAVSSEGRVFGRGSNYGGKLGFGGFNSEFPSFTEVSSLFSHKIIAAYAGYHHSLFQTCEGKILGCGENGYNQLLFRHDTSNGCVYSPTETTITSGATFCIAGDNMSAVFIGGKPPLNTPNMPFQFH